SVRYLAALLFASRPRGLRRRPPAAPALLRQAAGRLASRLAVRVGLARAQRGIARAQAHRLLRGRQTARRRRALGGIGPVARAPGGARAQRLAQRARAPLLRARQQRGLRRLPWRAAQRLLQPPAR